MKLAISALAFSQAAVHAGLKLGMTSELEETAGGVSGSVAGYKP